MIESTTAKRYAKSFILVAAAKGIVEEVEDQLLLLKEAYLKEPKIRQFMTNPRVPQKAQVNALRKMFEGKVNKLTLVFLELLVKRHRFNLIPVIADAFDEMADAFRGVVRVEVHTFSPLREIQRKNLEAQLVRIVRGSKVDLQIQEDPSLMGGIWVRIGDTLIDGSVATKLKSLRERLFDLRLG